MIEVVPDIINIEISVSGHDRRNAAKAKSQVDATSSKAVAALIANGVREADIFSSSMGLEEDYRYDDGGNARPAGQAPGGRSSSSCEQSIATPT